MSLREVRSAKGMEHTVLLPEVNAAEIPEGMNGRKANVAEQGTLEDIWGPKHYALQKLSLP